MVCGISGVLGVYRAVQYGVGHLMRTLPAGSSVGHGYPPVPHSPVIATLSLTRPLLLCSSLSLSRPTPRPLACVAPLPPHPSPLRTSLSLSLPLSPCLSLSLSISLSLC